jgi:hypothetical protein
MNVYLYSAEDDPRMQSNIEEMMKLKEIKRIKLEQMFMP